MVESYITGGMTMYTQQPKKLMIINILDILRRYTDKEHRLSQKEIAEILKNEYQMKADRKAVKRNLMNLIDFGYDIEYSETIRMTPNAKTGELEENYILSDFYLRREFDDSELRLLIDSLLFFPPYSIQPVQSIGGKAGRVVQHLFPIQSQTYCNIAG